LPAGVLCGAHRIAQIGLCPDMDGRGGVGNRVLRRHELGTNACLGLVGFAIASGYVGRIVFRTFVCLASCWVQRSSVAAFAGGLSEFVESSARERLFRADLAELGTRALHPFSWTGAMGGLALALCRIGVCFVDRAELGRKKLELRNA
jgi:hypothetical protein